MSLNATIVSHFRGVIDRAAGHLSPRSVTVEQCVSSSSWMWDVTVDGSPAVGVFAQLNGQQMGFRVGRVTVGPVWSGADDTDLALPLASAILSATREARDFKRIGSTA